MWSKSSRKLFLSFLDSCVLTHISKALLLVSTHSLHTKQSAELSGRALCFWDSSLGFKRACACVVGGLLWNPLQRFCLVFLAAIFCWLSGTQRLETGWSYMFLSPWCQFFVEEALGAPPKYFKPTFPKGPVSLNYLKIFWDFYLLVSCSCYDRDFLTSELQKEGGWV